MADQISSATAGRTDDEKMKGALAYVLMFITGVIVLVIAGDNKFLKFHAWQSIVGGIALCIVLFIVDVILSITVIGACLAPLLSLLVWLYFLYGAYTVYTGKDFKMPVVADFVEKTFMK
jgi:uncharacterized membrane protein